MRRRDVKDGEMSPEEQIDNHADRNKMNERTGRRKKGERRGGVCPKDGPADKRE